MGLLNWLFASRKSDPVSRPAEATRNRQRDGSANDAFAYGSYPYAGAGADSGASSAHGSSGSDGGSCDSGGGGGCGDGGE